MNAALRTIRHLLAAKSTDVGAYCLSLEALDWKDVADLSANHAYNHTDPAPMALVDAINLTLNGDDP